MHPAALPATVHSSPHNEKILSTTTIYIMPVRPVQITSSANGASSGRDAVLPSEVLLPVC